MTQRQVPPTILQPNSGHPELACTSLEATDGLDVVLPIDPGPTTSNGSNDALPIPIGIQSPKLRTIMDVKYFAFRRSLYTPIVLWRSMIGSLQGMFFVFQFSQLVGRQWFWSPTWQAPAYFSLYFENASLWRCIIHMCILLTTFTILQLDLTQLILIYTIQGSLVPQRCVPNKTLLLSMANTSIFAGPTTYEQWNQSLKQNG